MSADTPSTALAPALAATVPLTGAEWDRLAELEETIAAGIKQFDETGAALLAIRDSKLYRATHKTFAEYLEQRWNISRARGYQLIGAQEDRAELSTQVDKAILDGMDERAFRAARQAPEEKRAAVIIEAAARDGGAPTRATIEAVIAEQSPQPPSFIEAEVLVPAAAGAIDPDMVRRDDPELIRQMFSPKVLADAHKANRAEREAERREERLTRIETIARGNKPLHFETAFPVILADPPWRYDFASDGADAIENHYPTMTIEEICALPVAQVATSDAILFLWTTSPKLQESMRVVEAWGFTYRTCAVWDKQHLGMGYYFRQQHELLLVATRGEIPVPAPSDRPVSVYSEKKTAHSAKPAAFAEMIERMYPGVPKLEMFCRSPRAGWTAWGNQADTEEVPA